MDTSESTEPINKQPSEILVEIFLQLPDGPVFDFVPRRPRAKVVKVPAKTTTLSLVCRRWRNVVCSTPHLWRNIHVHSSPNWFALCLLRCADVPANVTFQSMPRQATISLLWSSISKIQSLAFTSLDRRWMYSACAVLETLWPSLKELHIEWCNRLDDGMHIHIDAAHLPRLRKLSLVGFFLPLDLSSYPNLRSLTVRARARIITLSRFLDIAASFPDLEELDFHIVSWPSSAPEPNKPREGATLGKLHTLRLTIDSYSFAARLLPRLRVPSAKSVTVNVHAGNRFEHNTLSGLLPPDLSLTLPMLPHITSADVVVLYHENTYALRAHGETHTVDLSLDVEYETRALGNGFDWHNALHRALIDLIRLLGSAPLTSLNVRENKTHVPSSVWRDVFAHFPLLERVSSDAMYLNGADAATTFWTALAPVLVSTNPFGVPSEPSTAASCPLPHLREVTMTGARIAPALGIEVWAIHNALRARVQRGYRLQRLNLGCVCSADFPGPDDDPTYVSDLEDVVGELVLMCEDE